MCAAALIRRLAARWQSFGVMRGDIDGNEDEERSRRCGGGNMRRKKKPGEKTVFERKKIFSGEGNGNEGRGKRICKEVSELEREPNSGQKFQKLLIL